MTRIQIYPSEELAQLLAKEAAKKSISTSKCVVEILESYFNLTDKNTMSVSELTETVLKEVEEFVRNANGRRIEFDLYTASATFRSINMVCGGSKPSTVRAQIGKSMAAKCGEGPLANIRRCIDPLTQTPKLSSLNKALVYETFVLDE